MIYNKYFKKEIRKFNLKFKINYLNRIKFDLNQKKDSEENDD